MSAHNKKLIHETMPLSSVSDSKSDGCYNVGSQSGRKEANGILYRYAINSKRLHGETEDGKEISLKKI